MTISYIVKYIVIGTYICFSGDVCGKYWDLVGAVLHEIVCQRLAKGGHRQHVDQRGLC